MNQQRQGRQPTNRRRPTARSVAYEALLRIDHDGAYANLLVPSLLSRSELHDLDRRFVTELVYGTTRMRRACESVVERFVFTEPDPEIRTLLRLGAYQLIFARTARHAAVGETVELAHPRVRGFVNAVLRRVADAAEQHLEWPDLASRLSYPDWIVERIIAEMGEDDGIAALERMNQPAPVSERADGYIQDLASQWVADAVGALPGERILDLCAAPGGKATALAAQGALVTAVDSQAHRVALIDDNAERLGLDIETVVADGRRPPFEPASFDRVLLDAPCSGLGALRRRPDARWRIQEHDIDELAVLQGELLTAAASMVRPGGVLVYSVCTITAAESIDHPLPAGFEVIDDAPDIRWSAFGHGFRILPHEADTDGMAIIRYRRSS